jgi:hypothetical protein
LVPVVQNSSRFGLRTWSESSVYYRRRSRDREREGGREHVSSVAEGARPATATAQASSVAGKEPLPAETIETAEIGWMGSSFDLLNGVEITEGEPDSIPGELFDELFNVPERRHRR